MKNINSQPLFTNNRNISLPHSMRIAARTKALDICKITPITEEDEAWYRKEIKVFKFPGWEDKLVCKASEHLNNIIYEQSTIGKVEFMPYSMGEVKENLISATITLRYNIKNIEE